MTEMRDSTEGRVSSHRAVNEVSREMRDVDHTHPHTGEPFGDAFWSPAVAADGGAPDDADDAMRDVDHESPDDEGADRVFERGTEGRTESV